VKCSFLFFCSKHTMNPVIFFYYEGRSIICLPKKETTYHKKIFFIFQCSPLITQLTSPTFVATTLSPWKKILWLLFKPGRDCLLDFFIAWKSFTPKKFFHNSE
jgi:hypothetical protein